MRTLPVALVRPPRLPATSAAHPHDTNPAREPTAVDPGWLFEDGPWHPTWATPATAALTGGRALGSSPARQAAAAGPSLRAAFDAAAGVAAPATARLLDDNIEAWNARWRAVAAASSTIDAGYFSLERDVFGYAFLGHLLKKAREGKRVRVLTDAMADALGLRGFKSTLRGQDYLQELVAAGAEVHVYHPLSYRLGKLARPAVAASYHDKVLVVDGDRGILGGRNIAQEYYADPQDLPAAWRDTCVLLDGEGPAARLTRAFDGEFERGDLNWEIAKDRFGNWRPREVELIGAYALMDAWLGMPPLAEDEKQRLRSGGAAREHAAEELVARALSRLPHEGVSRTATRRERDKLRDLALELVRFPELRGSGRGFSLGAGAHEVEAKIVDRTSIAGLARDEIAGALLALTRGARKRIVIENPYVVLTEGMIDALADAGRRGVEIFLGTNSPLSTDSDVTQAFFLEDWPSFMARIPGLRLFVATGQRKHHEKVAVFDDEVSVVSTYNLDLLSSSVNSEVAAVLWSKRLAAESYRTMLADKDDPKNGVVEYTILRDEKGRAVLEAGKPVVTFGPEHHLRPEVLDEYRAYRAAANLARRHPWGAQLRHGELERVLPPASYVRREELTRGD